MSSATDPRDARRRPGVRGLALATALSLAAAMVVAAGTSSATAAGAACAAGSQVSLMAHPDDDLFFMNPDIVRTVKTTGWCTTSVYVTSGDAGGSASYYLSREQGVRAAYAQMAGVQNSWTSTTVVAAGHAITQSTLTAAPGVRLQFMRLPDGNIDGSGFSATGYSTLKKLDQRVSSTISTVDAPRQVYTRTDLVSTLGALITSASPTVIRTQDYVHGYGSDSDHSDHHAVGRLVLEARAAWAPAVTITPYLGYPSADLPANVSGTDLTAKQDAFLAYAPYDSQMCQSLAACSGRAEATWLPRQHTASEGSTPQPGPGAADGNAAAAATVTASSQNPADSQTASKVVDGVVDGYPGDYTAEWATVGGGSGSWVQLAWVEPISLNRVVLFDRPNTADRITAGTLTFSDGSTVAVPSLTDSGAGVTVSFPEKTTTSVRLTVSGVSSTTKNVGLAEFQAWTSGSVATPTPAPQGDNAARTATAAASSESAATGQTAAKAVDGVVDGYPGDYAAEWATAGGGSGSELRLSWAAPVELLSVVLYDRPNTADQVTSGTLTFSDGSTVAVPVLENSGTGVTVSFTARSTSSLRFTVTGVSSTTKNVGLAELQAFTSGSTATPTPPSGETDFALAATASASSEAAGQGAGKAIDGVVSGYPANYAAEWATTRGGAGSSLQLSWTTAVALGRVVLYDRPNTDDRVTGATITFSDGTTVAVPALDDGGGPVAVTFPSRTTTSLTITFTSVSATTINAGLAEVQAYAA